MDKLDRLGWADGLTFRCHGARLGIRVNDLAVLEKVREHLPPGWKPASSPTVDAFYSLIVGRDSVNSRIRRFHVLYQGPERLARTIELEDLFDTLESDLHFRVAVLARRRLFLHAGVVGWRGRAIMVPGQSMSGKTTLVTALVKAGATYYSDEFAPLDAQGWVHPYCKPLYMRTGEGERRRKVSVDDIGGRAGNKPLPVGLVALAEYRPGARWRPRTLSSGEGVLALLGHTLLARYKPQLALQTLGQVAARAVMFKGRRGEAEDLAEALLKRWAPDAPAPSASAGTRLEARVI